MSCEWNRQTSSCMSRLHGERALEAISFRSLVCVKESGDENSAQALSFVAHIDEQDVERRKKVWLLVLRDFVRDNTRG